MFKGLIYEKNRKFFEMTHDEKCSGEPVAPAFDHGQIGRWESCWISRNEAFAQRVVGPQGVTEFEGVWGGDRSLRGNIR